MIRLALLIAVLTPLSAMADGSLVATRSITGKSVIGYGDVQLSEPVTPGALQTIDAAIGKEARVTLYAGRPIRPGDLRDPAVVERNDMVRLSYSLGPLWIVTEGRALDRGARGARIRVMNLDSRSVVAGVVAGPGEVAVKR